MKARVLKKFRNKENGKVYNVGEMISLTEARFEEITKAGDYVEKVEEKAAEKPAAAPAAKTAKKKEEKKQEDK